MKYFNLFEQHSDYLTYKESDDYIEPNISYCQQEDEIHFNKYDPFNGYEYVDLGLPSGTLWATKNIGAESITDFGLYFAWGETTGYTASQVGVDKNFNYTDYKYCDGLGAKASNITKYNSTDGLTQLELEDDAAHVNMGGAWHTPTKEQLEELLNTEYVNCNYLTNYLNSEINCVIITSKTNNNTLCIPQSGLYNETDWRSIYCTMLSNERNTTLNIYYAGLGGNFYYVLNDTRRWVGIPVRGVVGEISQ